MMKLFSTDSMKISVRIACDDDDTTFRYSFVLSMKDRKKDEYFFFSSKNKPMIDFQEDYICQLIIKVVFHC